MIFTQIAAFVVLVAVPVGAVLYCAYAFFKKRKIINWTWKSFIDLYVIAALVILYTFSLYHRTYLFMFVAAAATYTGIRLFAFLRDRNETGERALKILYIVTAVFTAVISSWGAFFVHQVISYNSYYKENRPESILMISLPAFLAWLSICLSNKQNYKIFLSTSLLALLATCYGLYVHHDIGNLRFIKAVIGLSLPAVLVFLPFTFLIISLLELFQLKKGGIDKPYLPRLLAKSGLFFVVSFFAYVIYVCFFGRGTAKVWFFLVCFILPSAITLWINRAYFWKDGVDRAKRKSPADYFLIGIFVMGLVSYSTVQFNYHPMFVEDYKCLQYNQYNPYSTLPSFAGPPPPPNVFEKMFVKIPRYGGLGTCYCPEGRESLKLYEKSLCLPEPRKPPKQEEKTE